MRDLGIYIDSDVSMRSHVTKTVSACFAVLRLLRSIRRSVPRSVLQSLVTSVVMTRLDYVNSTLAGIPLYLLKRLQSVMNSAARLVNSATRASRYVRPCRSTSPSTALVDGSGVNRFQARSPCLQVSARDRIWEPNHSPVKRVLNNLKTIILFEIFEGSSTERCSDKLRVNNRCGNGTGSFEVKGRIQRSSRTRLRGDIWSEKVRWLSKMKPRIMSCVQNTPMMMMKLLSEPI